MDYGIFDGLLDPVFVINADREILYCNEAGATLAESSVRRLTKKKPIHEIFKFDDESLFVMPNGDWGKDSATPLTEVGFSLKEGKTGHVQMVIQPYTLQDGEDRWIVVMRDTTLEETLHRKYQDQLKEREKYIKKLEEAQEKLEAYSKNLEAMVEERTAEIKKANSMLNAIMNSLGQGFLVFDQQGKCADFYTKACEDILEKSPAGKEIWNVIDLKDRDKETFKMWMQAVFSQSLPFENLKELAPQTYNHSQARHVTLDYFPIQSKEEDGTENIVLVATDKTAEHEANIALEKERQFAKMVVKLVTGRSQFNQFLASAHEMIKELLTLAESANTKTFDHELAFRMLHTFEGEVATYSAQSLWQAARDAQEDLEPLRFGTAEDTEKTLKCFKEKIMALQDHYKKYLKDNENLFQMLGVGGERKIEVTEAEVKGLLVQMQQKGVPLDVCQLLQDELLMEAIGPAFKHYQDVIEIVAEKQGKPVPQLEIVGGETKYYAQFYGDLMASMVHAFRNAVDHGIEPAEEREMCGKPGAGHIRVEILRQSSGLKFVVKDDGQGIDPQRVREKLANRFSEDELRQMSDKDVLQYIFESGLTTRESVGDFSGRGVGMEAIRFAAKELGGQAFVESQLGQGTQLVVDVPDLRVDLLKDQNLKKVG